MTHLYELGDNVCYNEDMYKVLSKVTKNDNLCYVLKKLDGDNLVFDVLETECKECLPENIIEYFWNTLVYTGDNVEFSSCIMECIIKKVSKLKDISFGPNADNTQYVFSINNGANYWTKNKQ